MINFSEFCYDGAQSSSKITGTSSKYFSKSENKDDDKNKKKNILKKDTKDVLKKTEKVSNIDSRSNSVSDSNNVSNVDSSIDADNNNVYYSNVGSSIDVDSKFVEDYNDFSDSDINESPRVDFTIPLNLDSTIKSELKNKTSKDPRHPMFRYTLPREYDKNIIEEFMFIPPPPK